MTDFKKDSQGNFILGNWTRHLSNALISINIKGITDGAELPVFYELTITNVMGGDSYSDTTTIVLNPELLHKLAKMFNEAAFIAARLESQHE